MKRGFVVLLAFLVLLALAFFVSWTPVRTYHTFGGNYTGSAGNAQEGFDVEVDVSGGGTGPAGSTSPGTTTSPLTILIAYPVQIWCQGGVWLIDGNAYSTISVTVKIKVTYRGIKEYSLNVSILRVWLECPATGASYDLLNSPQYGINGPATDGVWDHYTTDPFTASADIDAVASALGLATDGTQYTVYYYFQVKVEGIGKYTGNYYYADSGKKSCTPAYGTWQYESEGTSVAEYETQISYASWARITAVGPLAVALIIVALWLQRRR